MTEELFRDGIEGGYLRECSARVLRVSEQGVVLDRTVFYPLGGGQAGDAGVIATPYGELVIADTRKDKASGDILHIPAAGQDELLRALAQQHAALPPSPASAGEGRGEGSAPSTLAVEAFTPLPLAAEGSVPSPLAGEGWGGVSVTARIDWVRRHRHMRLHTTTHLLCALLPYGVDGCSITADYARMDLVTTEPIDAQAVNDGLARLVREAHAVRTRWISDEELDANPQLVKTMSVQPPRGLGRVRLLEVVDTDLQPCGGTHVANTAEIGPVTVTKIEKKSARTRRVVLGLG